MLVTGEGDSRGSYSLDVTNLDQFNTANNRTLVFPAGAGPSQSALADFNADGKTDIVVSNAWAIR